MTQDITTNCIDEQKNSVLKAVCSEIQTTIKPITEICSKHNVTFRYLKHLAKNDENFAYLFEDALTQRAWQYMDEAKMLIDNAQPYFTDATGIKRESIAALNKVQQQVKFRRTLAEELAPDIFGNLRHEIKQLEKQIKNMQKELDVLIK